MRFKSSTSSIAILTALAVSAGSATAAQQTAATEPQGADVETITVTGSRIQIQGYEAPTPVTVVDLAALERDGKPDLGDAIRQLPSFGASSSPSNSVRSTYISDGSAGLNVVSLRNLGQRRTLVLFDGQRVVDANLANGGVDLSTIPSTLVERVDVVTGGASAAWGSNAVAGVVNIVINKKLDGLKINVEAGNNFDLHRQQYKIEAAYGTGFASDRGHVVVAASYLDSPDTYFNDYVPNNRQTRLVNNPAWTATNGQPKLIRADYVGFNNATPGGIITGGPLKGTYFVGPNATPLTFNYGNITGNWTNNGTPNTGLSQHTFGVIANPVWTGTAFGHASYDVTDDITASVQLNYGRIDTIGNTWSSVYAGTLTINNDNPFIPASVLSQMNALGITSFPFGSTMTGDVSGNGGSIRAEAKNIGMPVVELRHQLYRGVLSLDGKATLFDRAWTWNSYYQHGESRGFNNLINNPFGTAVRNAVDAVRVTSANVGNSGLTIGSIACRSTLTAPTNGCVPWDPFGTGKDGSAASAYINGLARSGADYFHDKSQMDTGAASASGSLPFGLPAGDISAALGVEYRVEIGAIRASAAANAGGFPQGGNTKNFYGKYNTKEGFVEFNVPLLKDQVVRSLDVDVAGRVTDYSVSGTVETYKIGLLSQVNDMIRARASYSRDIRAPDLYALFTTGQPIANSATDPRRNQSVNIFAITQGNGNLQPEIGKTLTAGLVLTPQDLVPGLRISADWWQIKMTNVITTTNLSTTVAQCVAGVQSFCNNLVYGGPPDSIGPTLSAILLQPTNAALQRTSGFDMQSDYRTPFLAGDINFHFVGTYMYEDLQNALGVTYDAAGAISEGRRTSVPKFKGTLSATYSQDKWDATAQARIVGKAKLNNAWVSGVDVDKNEVAAIVYMDLRGSYQVNENFQLYAAMDNALDKAPPVIAASNSGGGSYLWYAPTRDALYDVFGRTWRMGLRARF